MGFWNWKRLRSHLIQTLHWMDEETEVQWGKELTQGPRTSGDTARTGTRVSKLPFPHWLPGSLCSCVTLSVGERGLFTREGLQGGLPLSCQRKESRGGSAARQEGFRGKLGSLPCCRAVISLRTCSYSNHMLCAGLAALNYEPREGLSSRRGWIPACLATCAGP